MSPLGFAACQSKKCTDQASNAPTKQTVHQPNNNGFLLLGRFNSGLNGLNGFLLLGRFNSGLNGLNGFLLLGRFNSGFIGLNGFLLLGDLTTDLSD